MSSYETATYIRRTRLVSSVQHSMLGPCLVANKGISFSLLPQGCPERMHTRRERTRHTRGDRARETKGEHGRDRDTETPKGARTGGRQRPTGARRSHLCTLLPRTRTQKTWVSSRTPCGLPTAKMYSRCRPLDSHRHTLKICLLLALSHERSGARAKTTTGVRGESRLERGIHRVYEDSSA